MPTVDENYKLARQSPDAWMEAQSKSRMQLLADRAMRKLDMDSVPLEGESDYGDFERGEFVEAFTQEINMAYYGDLLEGMKRRDLVESEVDEEGALIYRLTEKGASLTS